MKLMKLKQTAWMWSLGIMSFLSVHAFGAPLALSSGQKVYTIPSKVDCIRRHAILLNGTWLFKYSPQSTWEKIQVPGEVAMQGYAIEHDKPFLYRRVFEVPSDYTGQNIFLRFDGVYSHAKLSVNGKEICEHHGGFTRWDVDITSCVQIGKKNEIQLEVTDRLDEISYASGYAHHPIGGILRDVTLFALPATYIYDVAVQTELDASYKDAVLRVSCSAVVKQEAQIKLSLCDSKGNKMSFSSAYFTLSPDKKEYVWELPVNNPKKWDAEHPELYDLTLSIKNQGKESCRFVRKVGFREVEIVGDRMLVNGKPVKLRGACRHDIHPELGRTTTAELDSLDVILFKESNMNFVRTSHYPPSEKFLDYCDRYGIYVECESAVCFVNTYRQKNYAPGATQDNSDYTERYVGQCREMVKSFRSHPSILFWSIGNESVYGKNFQACWDWVKTADRTRPVIFSYPGSVKEDKKIYDILSMHYQNVNGNVDQWGMSTRNFQGHGIPALFDEWAHPACYTYTTLQNDPNIREFWGKSLDLMWSGLFDAPGGLGGAIWGYIDETFALPKPKVGTPYWKEFARTAKPLDYQGDCIGYGEWGIVDVWRRRKPEFWSTKKAYSPIRILEKTVSDFVAWKNISLPIYNRFDHTNLNEIKATYTYKGIKNKLQLPVLEPHQKGVLSIPSSDWERGEHVLLEFFSADGTLIEACKILLGEEDIKFPQPLFGSKLELTENDSFLLVKGKGFEIPFNKKTGLIENAKAGNRVLIENGPFLNLYINLNHLTGAEVRKAANHYATIESDWKKTDFSSQKVAEMVYVKLSGTYKDASVDYTIKINPNGQLSMDYTVSGVPNGYLRESGVSFYLADDIQYLNWKRKGYWDYYPKGEFAGNEGAVSLYNKNKQVYGENPQQPWQTDTHNYYYWADAGANSKKPLTQMAKGMKENVYYYSLLTKGTNPNTLSVVSKKALLACRMNKKKDESLILYINNRWDYPEIAWGNYCKTIEAIPCLGHLDLMLK